MIELTKKELDSLIKLKATTRKSYADLADLQWNDRSKASALRSLMRKQSKLLLPDPEILIAPPILTAPNKDVLVIADLHAPYQNTALLQIAIDLAVSAGVTHVDIAGDLHNFNALSSLSKGEPHTLPEVDTAHSRQILTVLANWFEEIRIVSGNHDEYWIKKRGGSFQDLIYTEVLQGKYGKQVFATNYDYLLRGDNWLIGHLSSYDETPGKLASIIADKVHRNVLVGHDHLSGVVRSKEGYIGASIGAMLTPDRFYYKNRRINTFPDFILGFALIINNKLYMFNEHGNGSFNGSTKDFEYWKQYFKDGI